MQIDHDENDNKKFPNYGDRQFHEDRLGRSIGRADGLRWIFPIFLVAVVMFFARTGWPF